MKHNEVKDRIFFVPAKPREDRATIANMRRRGENKVEKNFNTMEEFNDFFEYEKDLSELKPARETIEFDFHKREEDFLDKETSFIVMNKVSIDDITTNDDINNDGVIAGTHNTESESLNKRSSSINVQMIGEDISANEDEELEFDFKQCVFRKDDNFRCKKQVKKGHEYCGLHIKYINKNK
jgi:hypothetical protein